MAGAEKVSQALQAAGTLPKFDIYEKRKDIPRRASAIEL